MPAQPPPAPPPKRTASLSVQEGSGLAIGPPPLGIHVGAPPPGADRIDRWAADRHPVDIRQARWPQRMRVSASEISGVSVIPPNGFIGQMQLTAESRDGDGVALTGTSTRLSWTPLQQ